MKSLTHALAIVAAVMLANADSAAAQAQPPQIINLNPSVDVSAIGPLVSNDGTPSGAGLVVIGPNEETPGARPVDHARIVQMGFGIDPIYTCYFANGTAGAMTITRNRESLCTFQARGCSSLSGCTLDGRGFGLSPAQLRIISCQDWTPGARCTRVQLSTTERDTSAETAKVNWSDGGHVEYGNARPAPDADCGTAAAVEGTDNGFRIRMGRGAKPTCTVRFHSAWTLAYGGTPYRPVCTASNETRDVTTRAIAASATVALAGVAAGDDIAVVCVGRHDLP